MVSQAIGVLQVTLRNTLPPVLVILISFICVHGQSQSQYDKGTPPQLAAGVSSLGSYMSTELGTVNLTNGALNFNIPLGTVGGRGNVQLPLMLSYSSKVWSASMDVDTEREFGTEQPVAYADYDNQSSFAGASAPGWTIRAGMGMSVRFVKIKRIMSGPSVGCYTYGLHKLTLNLPEHPTISLRSLVLFIYPGRYTTPMKPHKEPGGVIRYPTTEEGIPSPLLCLRISPIGRHRVIFTM